MYPLKSVKYGQKLLLLVRELGSFLSSLIMPNLSVFIAWGFINLLANYVDGKLFLLLNGTEDILINFLLPLLIGYTGGKKFDDNRGGAIAGIATIGVMVGTDNSPVLGAMLIGPLAAMFFKKINQLVKKYIKQGYEMVFQNILAGLIGTLFCLLGLFIFTPIINYMTSIAVLSVSWLITHHLLPLVSIIIEPLKVFFFNNAINHGVLTPIGLTMVKDTGKSVLFLLEANPGPGFGILMAFLVKGSKTTKEQAAGASFIQLLGGIHEVYFPFVLMEPMLFFVIIISGVTGTAIFELLNVGLSNPVSPGSLILILTSASLDEIIGIMLGIFVSAVISFGLGCIVLNKRGSDESDTVTEINTQKGELQVIKEIIVVCDAGVGSSAMGATLLEKQLKDQGYLIPVSNESVHQIKNNKNSLILIHPQLKNQLLRNAPDVILLEITNFLDTSLMITKLSPYLGQKEFLEPEISLSEPHVSREIEIVLLFEGTIRGSQTMAIELMTKRAEELGVAVNISKENVETLKFEKEIFYIVTNEFNIKYDLDELGKRLIILSDLFAMSEFESWLKGVN